MCLLLYRDIRGIAYSKRHLFSVYIFALLFVMLVQSSLKQLKRYSGHKNNCMTFYDQTA